MSLHVASAASPTVAALLAQASQQLGGGRPVPVVDVVATPADDPRGAAFAAGFLPLLLTSILAGAGLAFAVRSRFALLGGLLVYGVLAGLAAAGVQHGMGLLTGDYVAEAAVDGLLALAIAATVAGLGRVIGRAGIGVGVLTMFVLGNPISAVASAPELLPKPWGLVGQLLPPGAGASLLRSVAFFDGAGAGRAGLVLAAWALGGVVLAAAGSRSMLTADRSVGEDEASHGMASAGVAVPAPDRVRDASRWIGDPVPHRAPADQPRHAVGLGDPVGDRGGTGVADPA
jgi:hypothetical protein